MFGAILIQVFYRYVLKAPLIWPYEVSIYCYIYTVFIGAAMAARRRSLIAFDLLYRRFTKRTGLLVDAATNLLISIVLIMVLQPTVPYIELIGSAPSSGLGIPLGYVLSAFPLGMGLVTVSLCIHAGRDLKEFFCGETD